jgi:predicted transposase/invertase (TIGR01784 family)
MKAMGQELERHDQEEFYSMYDWLIDQGIEKGIEKGIVKTALNLQEMGFPIEVISQATNLSITQLKQIIKDAGL